MSGETPERPLLFVADAHLTEDDAELESFLAFLEGPAAAAGTLCILGDLFNVWFGEPKFRLPHQERVLAGLRALAGRGVALAFVEGNRDFSIRRNHLGDPFREVATGRLVQRHAGRRILAEHGDEVNRDDRQYLMWKRLSKSAAVYGPFRLLPGSWGVRLGHRLEGRLSGTNLRHKIAFPEAQCRAYASRLLGSVCDAIVLGHFHEEREIPLDKGTVYVVPTWRGHHRYLSFGPDGTARFVTAGDS